jgi:predicted DCC family thiol-disulfide oxidoreductase YuxK
LKNVCFWLPLSTFSTALKELIMAPEIYPLEFLYDGNCPICVFDVMHLRRADRRGLLKFIDVTAPDFNAAEFGRSAEELLARIHARRADGVVIEGPEVFRLSWEAIGYRWLVAPTRWPGLASITEWAYRWFARNRMTLSRRLGGVFERLTPVCDDNVCRRPRRGDSLPDRR